MKDRLLYRLPSHGRQRFRVRLGVALMAIVAGWLLLAWGLTQWTAWRLGGSQALGEPWLEPNGIGPGKDRPDTHGSAHFADPEEVAATGLLTPDEAMRLPDDEAPLFVAGHPPVRAGQDPLLPRPRAVPPGGDSGARGVGHAGRGRSGGAFAHRHEGMNSLAL